MHQSFKMVRTKSGFATFSKTIRNISMRLFLIISMHCVHRASGHNTWYPSTNRVSVSQLLIFFGDKPISIVRLHFPFPSSVNETKCLLSIYRSFSHRLLHCYDFLWNPHLLPRSRYRPILRFWWNDIGCATMPIAQGCWHSYDGFGLLFGHLLLRYHRLDDLLHGGHLQCHSGSPLGHLR